MVLVISRISLLVGVSLVLCSFALCVPRLLSCLIVLENLNVLLLFSCLVCQFQEFRVLFLALVVIFTVEVVLGLVILTRLWDSSGLIGSVGL